MILAACFDGSYVCGKSECGQRDLDFHNLERTGHAGRLKGDYSVLRDHGFKFFRDSAWLKYSYHKAGYNWSYLDELAEQSQGDIQLTVCHYEFIEWEEFALFCYALGERYRGKFHSYIVVCESGYWAHRLAERNGWKPHIEGGFWPAFNKVSKLTLEGAKALKTADPVCKIAMSEPWFWGNMEDLSRPFNTLLGKYDSVAQMNGVYTYAEGAEELLDIIGLNIYRQPNVRGLIIEARRRFEGKEIMITETNCYHNPAGHIAWMQEETEGTGCEIVCWSPVLPMSRFEDGETLKSGFLFDLKRNKTY